MFTCKLDKQEQNNGVWNHLERTDTDLNSGFYIKIWKNNAGGH